MINERTPESEAIKLNCTLKSEERYVLAAITWSPNGESICGISQNGTMWLWDIRSGEVRWRAKPGIGIPVSIEWSSDGRYLAIGTRQGSIDVVGISSTSVVQRLKNSIKDRGIQGLYWWNGIDRIFGIDESGTINRWEMYSGRLIRSDAFPAHAAVTWSAVWSPNGNLLVTGDAAGVWRARNEVDGSLAWAIDSGLTGSAIALSWDGSGDRLVSCAEGSVIQIWTLDDVREAWRTEGTVTGPGFDHPIINPPSTVIDNLQAAPIWASFSYDGTIFAARTRNERLVVWRDTVGKPIARLDGVHSSGNWGKLAAIHPRHNTVATVGLDGCTIELWRISP